MPSPMSQVGTPSGVRPTVGYGVNEYCFVKFVGWMRVALPTIVACIQWRMTLRVSALPRFAINRISSATSDVTVA
jgi:hypothetical protein